MADIEAQGWIAPAECVEVRVTLTDNERLEYATAEPEERYKLVLHGPDEAAGGAGRSWTGTPTSRRW